MSGRRKKQLRQRQQGQLIVANHVANEVLRVLSNQDIDAAANGLAWAVAQYCHQLRIPREKLIELIRKANTGAVGDGAKA